MSLHDDLVVALQIQWQKVVLQEQLELVDEEVGLLLSLRFGETQVEVDLGAVLEGLHRNGKERLVGVLDRRFHVLVVAKSAASDDDPLRVETALEASLELV